MRCAFLTMDNTDGWSIDADLAIGPLADLGWQVDTLPWRSQRIDWNRYDAVYVGTPWDYPEDPDGFLAVMEAIDASGATLVNPLTLLQWNISKTYLRDLEQRGADIVPTEWHGSLDESRIVALERRCRTERIIVKPVIGTNGTDAFLLDGPPGTSTRDALLTTFADRACMIQPFIETIRDTGEMSLFYIGGELSHAIHKTPASGDFRVQEERGARIVPAVPDEQLRTNAEAVMGLLEPQPLYARIDFVRDQSGQDLLMELELIEPSLYLRMDPDAPARFANAFHHYLTGPSQ